jgi:hypothetical protein
MELPINNTPPISDPAPAPAPAPMPAPSPAPAPYVPAEPAQSGTSLSSFFNSLNWVEVGFGMVGAAALFYTIYYYRYKLQIDKLMSNNMQKQIDDMRITLQDEIKNKQQPSDSYGNFAG